MIRVSDYIVTFLLEQGVRDIFTASGGGVIFLDDAIALNKKMKYYCVITNRPWPAAEAYTRVNGKIGVSVVTERAGQHQHSNGCGRQLDGFCAVAVLFRQAFVQHTIRKTGLRQLGIQEINIIDIVRPITKFAVMIEDPNNKVKILSAKAMYLARTDDRGQVWLDVLRRRAERSDRPG